MRTESNGPLATVRCVDAKALEAKESPYLPEAVLARVPLERLVDTKTLDAWVVRPLAALIRNDLSSALALLEGVETVPWPAGAAADDDTNGQDDEERP